MNSELSRVTAELLAAYDRLIAADKVTNGAEFKAYCARYNLDHAGMMSAARIRINESINRYRLERANKW